MGTGRPTKFRKEFIDEVEKFFSVEPYRKELMETQREYTKDGEIKNEVDKYKHVPNFFPTLVRFAKHLKVNYMSLWHWAELGEDPKLMEKLKNKASFSKADEELVANLKKFSDAYKMAKSLQEDFLIQNGLAGASPSAAFIFTAKNTTKMRDKIEQEITHREVKPLLEHLQLDSNIHEKEKAEERGS